MVWWSGHRELKWQQGKNFSFCIPISCFKHGTHIFSSWSFFRFHSSMNSPPSADCLSAKATALAFTSMRRRQREPTAVEDALDVHIDEITLRTLVNPSHTLLLLFLPPIAFSTGRRRCSPPRSGVKKARPGKVQICESKSIFFTRAQQISPGILRTGS